MKDRLAPAQMRELVATCAAAEVWLEQRSRYRLPQPPEWLSRFNALMRDLAALARVERELWDDLDLMDGSGECGPIVKRAADRARRLVIERSGFTDDQLTEAISERGLSKWCWVRGL